MKIRFGANQHPDSAERLSAFIQNLPGMAYRCSNDPRWPMEFVSEGCESLSGYSRRDFEEQRVFWGDLILPEYRDDDWQITQLSIDSNEPYESEYRLVTRSGQKRWMWDRGRVVTLEDSGTVCLEGFITDITDRKRAEFELRQEQGYSEAIVDTAVEGVITVNADGNVETFNLAAQRMFGYVVDASCNKQFSTFMAKTHRQAWQNYWLHFRDSGGDRFPLENREVQVLREDGSDFPAQISVSEIQHQADRKFVCLVRDLSVQHAAEAEAREHRARLAHLDRLNMLGEMATGIAHEINQPLTAISLFAKAGKRFLDTGKPERLPEIFDLLSQHAQRAGSIIERVQSLARREASSREVVECNVLLKEVAALANAEARIRDIIIEFDLGSGIPAIWADTVQIQQVVLNLIRNGMEAMKSVNCCNGSSITLKSSLVDSGYVEVAVIDSGCGVTEDTARKLFKPFSTTKDYGMGMGLSICRAIISAHGGELSFKNNEHAGASFYFSLPTAEEGEDDG